MSQTFHERSVKASRKRRSCSWCGEAIEIGEAYSSYRFSDCGDTGLVIMHPECLTTMDELARSEGNEIEWSPGQFRRGSPVERCE